MKKIALILQIATLIVSTQAFAYDAIIEGQIKVAQGDAGGPCMSGYMIEGTDLNTGASIVLCAQVSTKMNYGPVLSHQVGKMSKMSRAKFAQDPLTYFAKQGTMRFSGSAADDDIEFTIASAEIIGE